MADISVVIACVNGLPWIDECLAALHKQRGAFDAEIIVVDRCGFRTQRYIERNYPRVKLLKAPANLGIPHLRAIGMKQASADIIVVTEDHCIATENWFEEIVAAHRSGYSVVGGLVENGSTRRIRDWAAFFCEYSSLMPPLRPKEQNDIAGNNASYQKRVLDEVDDSIKSQYWEYFMHEELRRKGAAFHVVPSILVTHKKEFNASYFLAQRYHYSRSFAAMRRQRVSSIGRLRYLLLSPALPLLILYRVTCQVLNKGRYLRQFILSFPLLAIFSLSYACGEFVGYLRGPGNSLAKVQ